MTDPVLDLLLALLVVVLAACAFVGTWVHVELRAIRWALRESLERFVLWSERDRE
jgi:hypothetical protein